MLANYRMKGHKLVWFSPSPSLDRLLSIFGFWFSHVFSRYTFTFTG